MNSQNMSSPLRLLTFIIFLLSLVFPLSAQEQTDSVVTFKFLAGRNMFYSPFEENRQELARLFDCVDRYKEEIAGDRAKFYVDGYCDYKESASENLRIAKIRSNRVKSELITRKGLKEDNFVTKNHADEGNFVTVSLILLTPAAAAPEVEEPVVEIEIIEDEIDTPATSEPTPQQPAEEIADEPEHLPAIANAKVDRFALKTNLLYYAALMPNVQIEWMFANRWSAALEFQGAWYAKETPHKVYRVSTLMPEVRYWVIDRSRWHGMYVGLLIGGGLYDLCNGKTEGHKGEGGLAGVSAGYMWPVSKHLSLEAGIGIGYMRLRDKVYTPLDGHFLYQYSKNINYFGPLRLNFSLAWRF